MDARVGELLGGPVKGRSILDVGAGQILLDAAYFAAGNDVTAIDADVYAAGFDVAAYVRMTRKNGVKRTLKTVARKTLGIDRAYRRTFQQQLGLDRFPYPRVLQMDANALEFEPDTFDVAYSLLVFQHLPQPETAAAELARVVRPGGVVYIDITLYTGPTGALDVRALAGEELQGWAHLRGAEDEIRESAYVNELRLHEWQELFGRILPGHDVDVKRAAGYEAEAKRAHAAGELPDYTLDELLAVEAIFTWRKPVQAVEPSEQEVR
jgi:SAM-dependent methyltransferase